MSFRVEEFWPGSVLNSALPCALVFPESREDTTHEKTCIEPITPADGLRRLIELNWPVRLPWGFDGFLDTMRDMTERTPCYRLQLGHAMDDVPERIDRLIA